MPERGHEIRIDRARGIARVRDLATGEIKEHAIPAAHRALAEHVGYDARTGKLTPPLVLAARIEER
jgi:hypothetical protein